MSRSALAFLTLTLLCAATLWLRVGDTGPLHTALVIAFGVFSALSMLTLVAGRKIRFDPVLRRS